MNEKNHEPDERLERMLRRWGVAESARRVGVPPMPEMTPQRRWKTILLRWGPPAAAAAMLLVAVGLFVITFTGNDTSPAQEDVENLKAELAQVRTELARARKELETSRENHASELAQLEARFRQEKEKLLGEADRRITALRNNIAQKEARLEQVAGELDKTLKRLASADAERKRLLKSAQNNERTRIRLAAAVSELDRVNRKYRQVLTDSQKVQSELVALKARNKTVFDDFQRAYLSAAAAAGGMENPGRRIDLAVRQSAARGAALLERCAELRSLVPTTDTGRLMDRLEVVLTRLELLNPADVSEAEAFASLVRRGGLVREIDAALSEGRRSADVRTWILEARMILEGAENVG
ncbi:MAG: hypothetical protein SVV80_08945 [Planctomycetota bacterium]|nr:hypothetical protein [Planctomycetota bacterium]